MKRISPRAIAIAALQGLLGVSAALGAVEVAQAQTSGLVAAYSFNESSGSLAADASGAGNPGTLNGPTWSPQGKFGGALAFDGSSDWVTIADSSSLRLTNGMTIEAWVNPITTSGSWKTVLIKESDGQVADYALYTNDDALAPASYIGWSAVQGNSTIPLNTWTHLAATFDGTTFRLYVNGSSVNSRSVSGGISTSTRPVRIGGNNMYGEWFQGRIDEVRIYSRALTAAQIQSDMNTPIGAPSPTTTSTCDLTGDGRVDGEDVSLSVDMALGLAPCRADIVAENICDIVVTQRVVNATLGEPCITGEGGSGGGGGGVTHSVLLSWTPSTSSNVIGHNIYRSTQSGSGYVRLNSSLVVPSQFTDSDVQSGQTYYYVVTAVNSSNLESTNSNQAMAVVP